jgi:Transglycosylase SLT domain
MAEGRFPVPACLRGMVHVALALVFLVGGPAVAEVEVANGEEAPALALEEAGSLEQEPSIQPALPLKPLATKPLTPADLPPPSVFSPRSLPITTNRSLPTTTGFPIQRQPGMDRGGYRAIIEREAMAQGVPPELVDAVMSVESGYNPAVVGADGEIGLMQIMPATASMLGFTGTLAELAVPETNIRYGVMYLAGAWRLAGQDVCTATMKYRAGHGQTRFSFRSVDYCTKVRARLFARGYPVTGTVPQPTFGQAVGGLTRLSRGQSLSQKGPGVNLAALNATLRELTHKTAVRTSR